MLWVKEHYAPLLSAIVPGGLRWTEGIEYGLTEVHGTSLPPIPKHDNEKDLPAELAEVILELARLHLPNIPVYFKSSCAITHMLRLPSISSVQVLARRECEMSLCPLTQRHTCASGKACSMGVIEAQKVIDRLGVPAKVMRWDASQATLITEPPLGNFTYALRQAVLNNLSRGE